MKIQLLKIIAALSLICAFAGCVTPPEKNQFDAADFEAFKQPGTAVITGQTFLKTRGGDVKFGAGNTVELIPATPYTRERFSIAASYRPNPYSIPNARHPELNRHVRTTVADGFGNFEFTDLPAGDYILSCMISWSAGGYGSTGAQAVLFVTVKDGQKQKVILTK